PLLAALGGVEAAPADVPQWQLAGIGDFNGDGSADLLSLRNDGLLRVDTLNAGGELTNWYIVGRLQAGWQIAGIGDINGDGTSDILLRNQDGTWQAELIRDHTVAATVDLVLVDGAWRIADANSGGTTGGPDGHPGTPVSDPGPEPQTFVIMDPSP